MPMANSAGYESSVADNWNRSAVTSESSCVRSSDIKGSGGKSAVAFVIHRCSAVALTGNLPDIDSRRADSSSSDFPSTDGSGTDFPCIDLSAARCWIVGVRSWAIDFRAPSFAAGKASVPAEAKSPAA